MLENFSIWPAYIQTAFILAAFNEVRQYKLSQ